MRKIIVAASLVLAIETQAQGQTPAPAVDLEQQIKAMQSQIEEAGRDTRPPASVTTDGIKAAVSVVVLRPTVTLSRGDSQTVAMLVESTVIAGLARQPEVQATAAAPTGGGGAVGVHSLAISITQQAKRSLLSRLPIGALPLAGLPIPGVGSKIPLQVVQAAMSTIKAKDRVTFSYMLHDQAQRLLGNASFDIQAQEDGENLFAAGAAKIVASVAPLLSAGR